MGVLHWLREDITRHERKSLQGAPSLHHPPHPSPIGTRQEPLFLKDETESLRRYMVVPRVSSFVQLDQGRYAQ